MDAAIERIARLCTGAEIRVITARGSPRTRRRMIDAVGCGLGGYDDEPCRMARKLASRVKVESGARILGIAHRTLPDLATFANGVMTRYLDGKDTFPDMYRMKSGGHPSEVIAAEIAAAELIEESTAC